MAEGPVARLRAVAPAAVLVGALLLAAAPSRVGAATPPECVTLEDFATAQVGQFPRDWQVRTRGGRELYRVVEERGLRFLRASVRGLAIQAAKAVEWDLDAYPILVWSWRVGEFPRGADERDPATNDSALAVYLLVPYSRVAGPRAVKYIWSETVAVGTRLASNRGLTQVRVLRTGAAPDNAWVEERVNARDDFTRYFGLGETPRPAGIALLTDADDTRSSAQGDYASFRACRG